MNKLEYCQISVKPSSQKFDSHKLLSQGEEEGEEELYLSHSGEIYRITAAKMKKTVQLSC